MTQTTTLAARARTWRAVTGRRGLARVLVLGLLAMLVMPLLMTAFAPAAHADEETDNYSLYQLSSNASTYFSRENSPASGKNDPSDRMNEEWQRITGSAATGGSMLGYADPEFSLSDAVGWLFAEVSGSSQTIGYSTLTAANGGEGDIYAGMLDYAHFGAANEDLGLDTMSSGIGGQIIGTIGGSVIWMLYALALAVGMVFYVIIQILKLVNPFLWFHAGISAVSPAYATWADGMVDGGDRSLVEGGGPLAGLSQFIASWYGTLADIAWQALVPLFIGFLLIGLVLFKKMDRGSAIKKLIVRIVFIGVGVPLVGSMYTSVLDKFDDSVLGQHAGPTRVVLSTYVDFEAWMMNDRLAIPAEATISWDNGQAGSDAQMAVRTSALAINVQSHGGTFADINVGSKADNAESAWRSSMAGMGGEAKEDANAVFKVFAMIGNYITSSQVAASDFESGVKSSITKLDVDTDDKKKWFVEKDGYGDAEKYTDADDPEPTAHPVIATRELQGLTSSSRGGDTTTFTTTPLTTGCGFTISAEPAACNMSALAAYNYLNTGFGSESLTMYSSNNATSGFTRENHMSISQVGTGPAKFMYWLNAATVLGCIALLGFWYAIGMLVGTVKRTFSLVAAIPFATLGAVAAISKVIVYSAALILEVLVTLFIYQFVAEFLIAIPDIIAGPMSSLMSSDGGLFGTTVLGGIVVVILTLISSLLIIGVTVALLRVRKVVLQAMDEAVTKLVDKFLDTNTAPKPEKGGMMPALAAGAGAGAGMAAGQKLSSAMGGKLGGGPKGPGSKPGGGKPGPTNAGGTNGGTSALSAGGALALEGRGGPGNGSDGGSPSPGGDDGGGPTPLGGSGGDVRALPGGNGSQGSGPGGRGHGGGPDTGTPLQLASGSSGSSRSDKDLAQGLSARGGLSNLGYGSGGRQGPDSADGSGISGGVAGTSSTAAQRKPQDGAGTSSRSGANGAHFSAAGGGSTALGARSKPAVQVPQFSATAQRQLAQAASVQRPAPAPSQKPVQTPTRQPAKAQQAPASTPARPTRASQVRAARRTTPAPKPPND